MEDPGEPDEMLGLTETELGSQRPVYLQNDHRHEPQGA